MSGEGWNETCQRGVDLSQEICYVTYPIYLSECMYLASRLYIPIQLFGTKRNIPFCPCQSTPSSRSSILLPHPIIPLPHFNIFNFNLLSFLAMHSIVLSFPFFPCQSTPSSAHPLSLSFHRLPLNIFFYFNPPSFLAMNSILFPSIIFFLSFLYILSFHRHSLVLVSIPL